jgi:methylated-DNA-protein-cysteine methyltransferase-like protein
MHNVWMQETIPGTTEERIERILAVVARLLPGEVVTYGLIAARAGLPGRARLVGKALRTADDERSIPWHRVVGAGGRIAFPAGSAEAMEQAERLRREGVDVIGRRVCLAAQPDLDAVLWGALGAAKMPGRTRGRNR